MGTLTDNVLVKLHRPRGYIVVEPDSHDWQVYIGGVFIDSGTAQSDEEALVSGANALRSFERGLRGRVRSRRA